MATTADARLIADAINNLTKAVKTQTDILKKQESTKTNVVNVYVPAEEILEQLDPATIYRNAKKLIESQADPKSPDSEIDSGN